MKKLAVEEIQFIQNYLKNSGVEFLDVREEMTDHVATAIEKELEQSKNLDFYGAFKAYMLQHKKTLLKNATKHRWSIDVKVLRKIGENLFSPSILIKLLIFLAIIGNLDVVKLEEVYNFPFLFAVIILGGYAVPITMYYRLKVSFLSRLAIMGYACNFIFHHIEKDLDFSQIGLLVFYGSLFWVNMSIIKSAVEISAYYKKQYVEL